MGRRRLVATTSSYDPAIDFETLQTGGLGGAGQLTTVFQQYAPQGVRARDAIHAAVMQNHGLNHIISSDLHFDQIAGLIRLDPILLHQTATQSTP